MATAINTTSFEKLLPRLTISAARLKTKINKEQFSGISGSTDVKIC